MLGCLNDIFTVDIEKSLINPLGIIAHLKLELDLELYLPKDAIHYQVDEFINQQVYGFISPYNAMRLIECAESKYSRTLRDFILNRVIPFIQANKVELEILTKSQTHATTMSSLEIAKLTGKQHPHVMRDIKSMLEQAGIDESKFGCIYLDAYKREKPCYKLDRELTLCLVTGYSVPLRLKIIRRLDELEKQVAQPALQQITPPTPIKEIDRPQPTKQLNASFLKTAIKQIEEMTLSKDSKQVLKAHLLHEQAGLPLELMLPVTYEEKLSPAQIAQQLKVSPQAIGRIITKLGLRGNDDYCEGRLSQSTTSNKEVVMYFYNHQAVQMIKQRLEEKKSA
jgi:phage regulator Rha-like protein